MTGRVAGQLLIQRKYWSLRHGDLVNGTGTEGDDEGHFASVQQEFFTVEAEEYPQEAIGIQYSIRVLEDGMSGFVDGALDAVMAEQVVPAGMRLIQSSEELLLSLIHI
eukprot:TRINITY_DN4649_c0_g2_i1.p1 TRINITY_DN4649_c0_g2~~TRINITY_DN4649_c0_g2_i1.p1  ORF type:complete len:115 (-),score=21.79 TRINITY_DN4649_c0_g2_i1:30-353(-)